MDKLFERVKEIMLKTVEIWPTIKNETTDAKQLFLNYAAPLALIPFVAGMISYTIFGFPMPAGNVIRMPFFPTLTREVVTYFIGLLGVFITGWIINLLAPKFCAKSSLDQALKVAIYSLTPVWLAGLLIFIPGVGFLVMLASLGYYVFLLVKGLSLVLETPGDKIVVYTISVLLLSLLTNALLSLFIISRFSFPMYM